MSIRRQLTLIILLTVVLAAGLNSLISSGYLDTYFKSYIQTQYSEHVSKISDFATALLSRPEVTPNQVSADLSRYLDDPIIQIQILSADKTERLTVKKNITGMHENMMRGRRFQSTEEDYFALKSGEKVIGYLVILRSAAIQSSESVMLFKSALRMGGLLSIAIVLVLSVFFSRWISRRMTHDLRKTAEYASAIQTKHEDFQNYSKILEISAIQISLQDLSTKLKLQSNVQKEKVDQLTHEARTPLTLLKAHIEGILDKVVDADDSRLESCLHEINTLTNVISNIKNVIDYNEEVLSPKFEHFDLIVDAKKILKSMTLQYEQKGVILKLDAPHTLPIFSDRILLSQILYNLLTNAYKFTPAGGQVNVNVELMHAENQKDFIHISVLDSGIGIEAHLLEQLFEPYYRAPNVRHIPGEGLGLYIAKRNALALGGDLKASNGVDGGSCFVLNLPASH